MVSVLGFAGPVVVSVAATPLFHSIGKATTDDMGIQSFNDKTLLTKTVSGLASAESLNISGPRSVLPELPASASPGKL